MGSVVVYPEALLPGGKSLAQGPSGRAGNIVRTEADRAFDALHVEEFRGYGGDSSDTTMLQQALAYIRSTAGAANGFRNVVITGKNRAGTNDRYTVEESLNATAITSNNGWGLEWMTLYATCSGKPVIDMTGSRFSDLKQIKIYGVSGSAPSIGFFYSRLSTGVSADGHSLDKCATRGYFTHAALLNRASELFTAKDCFIWNQRDAGADHTAGLAYAAAFDGADTIVAASDYQTISTGNRAMNLLKILGGWYLKTGATGSAVFISRAVGLDFDAYTAVEDTSSFEVLINGVERRISLRGHFEGGSTSPPAIVKFTGTTGAKTIWGFRLEDHSPHVTTNIFQVSGPSSVTLWKPDVSIFNYNAGSITAVFDDNTKYGLHHGNFLIPENADYGDLSTLLTNAGNTFAALDNTSQPLGKPIDLFTIETADMNTTSDQQFVKNGTFAAYIITGIRCFSPSTSLTTAVGGIYSAASKGGNALVAASQAYTAAASSTSGQALTLATPGNGRRTNTPYLSLSTPQGGAATAKFVIAGYPVA